MSSDLDIEHVTPLNALAEYRQELKKLTLSLSNHNADFTSILRDVDDLQQRARGGFVSERVNMKSENEGVSALCEAKPEIEVACMSLKVKVNEVIVKMLSQEELPEGVTIVNIIPRNLEDVLADADR